MTLQEALERLGIRTRDYYFPDQDVYSITITGMQMTQEVLTVPPTGARQVTPPPVTHAAQPNIITAPEVRQRYAAGLEGIREDLWRLEPRPQTRSEHFDEARRRHDEALVRGLEGNGEEPHPQQWVAGLDAYALG